MSTRIDTNKIAEHAKANRWSAERIAAEIPEISAATVLNVLKGNNTPSATNLKAICDTIGLPIEEAFTEEAAV